MLNFLGPALIILVLDGPNSGEGIAVHEIESMDVCEAMAKEIIAEQYKGLEVICVPSTMEK